MASSTRTRRPAPKQAPKPASKRSAKRSSGPRRKSRGRRSSPPLLTGRQLADVAGLALLAAAAFAALVLWLGLDGAAAGRWLDRGARFLVGRAAVLLPPLIAAAGLLLVSHGARPRLRPALLGGSLLGVATVLALASDAVDATEARRHGGILGARLHGVVTGAVGTPGLDVLILFAGVVGLLLVTGASAGALLGRLRAEMVETARAVREAIPERAPTPSAKAPEPPPRRREPAPPPAPVAVEEEPPVTASGEFPALFVRDEPSLAPEPPREAGEPAPELAPEPVADDAPASASTYRLPDPGVLVRSTQVARSTAGELRIAAQLVEALAHFGVEARIVGTVSGPRVTRYELQLAPGTKVGKVSALRDDLAYALATTEIRILAPIPGKQAVGVEVPNLTPNIVTLGDIAGPNPAGASPLSVWLGKDIAGNAVHSDLAKMPHILIAGTTGSGKSGCVNAMLVSILLNATPEQVRLILIDPKKVELNHYEAIPHLLTPVVTNVKQAAAALLNIVGEMERRYERLGAARSKNIIEFNRARREAGRETLPYVLVVIDELADLMMVAPAEVEDAIIRLAQKSRAVGIHLVLATQRPSVDVITGMIKANVPSRIAFAVSSQTDSRVILDTGGAESLLGQGDMLYRPLGTSRLQRVQGAYVTEEEIALVVEQCRDQGDPEFEEALLDLPEIVAGGSEAGDDDGELSPDEDPLLDDAIRLVVNHETASVSLIQRRLRVGYTRAGRLIDMLERRGVISGYEGSKPRQVLISEADLPRLVGRPQ
jgi:S-DNA-T family DNA segregation ATPase FtsK/SpoIIIE